MPKGGGCWAIKTKPVKQRIFGEVVCKGKPKTKWKPGGSPIRIRRELNGGTRRRERT